MQFEKQQWAECLTDLSARRLLLSTLSEAARDSYDQALAIEFIDQYDPLIRFSAYKLGRAESHDIDGVVSDIDSEMMEEALPGLAKLMEGLRSETGVEEMEAGRKVLEDVEFAGEKVELRSAEIVGVMLKVQDAVGRLKGKVDGGRGGGMKGWDRVLSVIGDAEVVAKRLLDDHEVGFMLSVPECFLIRSSSGVRFFNIVTINAYFSITFIGTSVYRSSVTHISYPT